MSHCIKKILFSLLILMLPYMNFASKAVENENDDESSVCVRQISKEGVIEEDQQNIQSGAPSSQVNPWVLAVKHIAREISSFADNGLTRKALIFWGITYVADGAFQCISIGNEEPYAHGPSFISLNETYCSKICGQWTGYSCCYRPWEL